MAELCVNGLTFHVQRLGPPVDSAERVVVFVHGLVMDNLSSWFFTTANPAAARHHVLLYDLRGHGRSERPPSGYRVADMLDDLEGILAAAGLGRQKVELVGHSFGGLLALAFAIRRPERVSGMVLVDAQVADDSFAGEMRATLTAEGPEREAMIKENFSTWLGRHSERKRTRLAVTARDLVQDTTLVRDLDATPVHTDADLARIACPVLALYGESSSCRLRGERLGRVLADCHLELLPGSTHSVLWERTPEMRARILAFLNRGLAEGGQGSR